MKQNKLASNPTESRVESVSDQNKSEQSIFSTNINKLNFRL